MFKKFHIMRHLTRDLVQSLDQHRRDEIRETGQLTIGIR